MSNKTDYKKLWRGAQKENMMIVNAFTRLKVTTNRVIEIHNRQGAMIKDLIDGKVTAEEFIEKIKAMVVEDQAKTAAVTVKENIEDVVEGVEVKVEEAK